MVNGNCGVGDRSCEIGDTCCVVRPTGMLRDKKKAFEGGELGGLLIRYDWLDCLETRCDLAPLCPPGGALKDASRNHRDNRTKSAQTDSRQQTSVGFVRIAQGFIPMRASPLTHLQTSSNKPLRSSSPPNDKMVSIRPSKNTRGYSTTN